MTAPRILLFDSGMGGLTVARAVMQQMPEAHLVYAADNAAFPYGGWEQGHLLRRILLVMEQLIDSTKPDLVVVACNTASTIALADLRAKFALPFVGTVPAIKPAAAQTKSGVIGVLATPGTVKREYTQTLINDFAANCRVVLHGAAGLAALAERTLLGAPIDLDALRHEVLPAFTEIDGEKTDVVVLGCTHYPLLAAEIASVAPWPVILIDPSAAIARRVGDVADETGRQVGSVDGPMHGTVVLTARPAAGEDTRMAYASMGFPVLTVLNLPV